jgi:hypothetical protein
MDPNLISLSYPIHIRAEEWNLGKKETARSQEEWWAPARKRKRVFVYAI